LEGKAFYLPIPESIKMPQTLAQTSGTNILYNLAAYIAYLDDPAKFPMSNKFYIRTPMITALLVQSGEGR
jgi:hypothetical protein